MALTPFSGSSQVALSPRPTVLSVALARSDASLDDETQRTVSAFGRYRSEIQERLAAQAAEIRQLRELLVAANARPQELTIAHEEKMSMAQARIEVLERRAVAAEQERDAATRLGTEAEIARAAELQQEAVAARAETAMIRTESAQQMATALAERNAAVAAATQRGDALVAAERQKAQEERVKQERLTKLALQETEDTCKMQKFLGEFIWNQHEICATWDGGIPKLLAGHGSKYVPLRVRIAPGYNNPIPDLLIKLEALINERLARPVDSVLDRAMQQADTQQLELLDAAIMSKSKEYTSCRSGASHAPIKQLCEQAVLEILRPLIATRKVRIA